jgi:hypothetical protein
VSELLLCIRVRLVRTVNGTEAEPILKACPVRFVLLREDFSVRRAECQEANAGRFGRP